MRSLTLGWIELNELERCLSENRSHGISIWYNLGRGELNTVARWIILMGRGVFGMILVGNLSYTLTREISVSGRKAVLTSRRHGVRQCRIIPSSKTVVAALTMSDRIVRSQMMVEWRLETHRIGVEIFGVRTKIALVIERRRKVVLAYTVVEVGERGLRFDEISTDTQIAILLIVSKQEKFL